MLNLKPRNFSLDDIYELKELQNAIQSVYEYLTDNSCSDPDCCGGPFSSVEDFNEGLATLEKFGFTYGNP